MGGMLQQNERLFLQMLDVEYQSQPVDENKVMDVFQTILSSDLSIEFKVKISQRRMEFLEDFGTCVKRWAEPQPACKVHWWEGSN